MNENDKISMEEMAKKFPAGLPMEVLKILWSPNNNDRTVADVRAEIDAWMAAHHGLPASARKQTRTGRIFIHKTRGGLYRELGRAEVQATLPVLEGETMVFYQGLYDGKLWARPEKEFDDGRFEEAAPLDFNDRKERI